MGLKCKCGFKFSGPGEFRNCNIEIVDGKTIIVCPQCDTRYKNGE